MEYFLIATCAFLASLLAFYSGFGLGTLLMPVIAIFFPLPVAIALTAVVHLLHSALRTGLLWKEVNWNIVLRFGIPAVLAAIVGAWLLKKLAFLGPIGSYEWFGRREISLLHLLIGGLLIAFATLELFPRKGYQMKSLFWGGVLSGFFGGFSGNQGAFRSLFLMNADLQMKSFIGTNALISVAVDGVRLIIYGLSFGMLLKNIQGSLWLSTMGGAIGGVGLGMLFLKKITLIHIQKVIIVLLYLFGILLALGII
ncbi:MAG: sulfite exporter TauE/SafE family protein [Verrucomicrobia bacterium]|nr:sulfite exporter TauE/SafE family protein [Verrucomicrobiota bacterium]